jgi:hypothetical protein
MIAPLIKVGVGVLVGLSVFAGNTKPEELPSVPPELPKVGKKKRTRTRKKKK